MVGRNKYVYPGMPKILVNPTYFQESANHFRKHGYYCNARPGSKDFFEYWKEEHKRCVEGYSVGGMWIPGKYYFFLNYFPILREPEQYEKDTNKVSSAQRKIQDFPSFTEVQYHWHLAKDEAFNRPVGEGNHLVCVKTRRSGWSYQEACEGVYNYTFIKFSKSFYFGALQGYLTDEKDGVLPKAWAALSHLNKNTQRVWSRIRRFKNDNMHKRASYSDKSGLIEDGMMSEIIGILVDNPRKVRGASGLKLYFEEAGSFPNLLDTLETARPLVEESGLVGQIVVAGTGGEKEAKYLEGLETLFYEPHKHNFMSFDNIWGEEGAGDKLGFFVPYYIGSPGFYDEMGNPDIEACKARFEKEFEAARTSKNPLALQRKLAERPIYPSHVFIRYTASDLPVEDLKRQKMIASDPKIQGQILHGTIINSAGEGLKFVPTNVKPLKFPHDQAEDLTGCVSILDRPIEGHKYLVVVDPFAKDDAEDKTSIGSALVYEYLTPGNLGGDRIVAWYSGRPKLDTFHLNVVRLAEYYGANIQCEELGGGQGLLAYCRQNKKLHLCEYEPLVKDRKENHSYKNRNFFMKVSDDDKRIAHTYLVKWLTKERGQFENGNPVLNLHKLFDLATIEELLKYDGLGNFDRYSALLVLMWMIEERSYIKPKERNRSKSDFFKRNLFSDNPSVNGVPQLSANATFDIEGRLV